jgi:hypothetical protein
MLSALSLLVVREVTEKPWEMGEAVRLLILGNRSSSFDSQSGSGAGTVPGTFSERSASLQERMRLSRPSFPSGTTLSTGELREREESIKAGTRKDGAGIAIQWTVSIFISHSCPCNFNCSLIDFIQYRRSNGKIDITLGKGSNAFSEDETMTGLILSDIHSFAVTYLIYSNSGPSSEARQHQLVQRRQRKASYVSLLLYLFCLNFNYRS